MPNFNNLGNNQPYCKNQNKELQNFLTVAWEYNIKLSNHKSFEFFCRLGGDRKGVRLATRDKKPQYSKGSDWPTIEEHRKIKELVKQYGEHGERTGTKRGRLYFQVWDVDIRHKSQKLPCWLQRQIEKSFKLLAKIYRFSYIETQHGYQVYLLLEELSSNCEIYHRDSWRGIKRNIGSILSKGRQVQGVSSQFKKWVNNGKWFWKLKNVEELAAILKKFFFEVDLVKEKLSENRKLNENQKSNENISKNPYTIIRLEKIWIISKQITKKTDCYRVNYRNQQKRRGFFFLDSYFRDKKERIQPNLMVSLVIAKGDKYQFFVRKF